MGALVMWMAAGFAMLEAGLVRAKNTAEILTKNVVLFASPVPPIWWLDTTLCTTADCSWRYRPDGAESAEALTAAVLEESTEAGFGGDSVYSNASDFFFQVVFVATAMSIVSGAVAERMKLWSFIIFAMVMTAFIYPMEGAWTWGGKSVFGIYSLGDLGFPTLPVPELCIWPVLGCPRRCIVARCQKGKLWTQRRSAAHTGCQYAAGRAGTFILWWDGSV